MKMDRHHRLPRVFKGDRNKGNIIKVDKVKHSMFHQLFSIGGCAMTVEQIANELNTIWCDPNVEFVCIRRTS